MQLAADNIRSGLDIESIDYFHEEDNILQH